MSVIEIIGIGFALVALCALIDFAEKWTGR